MTPICFDEYLKFLADDGNYVVITDENVAALYPLGPAKKIVIKPGEEHKNMQTVLEIYNQLRDMNITRNSKIFAVGGGVVCDIAGFVAATYLRGLNITMMPTTLLSQVDASIGGKNGVDFGGLKNIIGTFRQPKEIIIDPKFLRTLSPEQMSDGLAEIVKIASVTDESLFEILEEEDLSSLNGEYLWGVTRIIALAADAKTNLVSKDVLENGIRRILNFGHTIGHAIELSCGVSHGVAVANGMLLSTKINERFFEGNRKVGERIEQLLRKINCPLDLKLSIEDIAEKIKGDKKRESSFIRFVVVPKIGCAEIKEINVDRLIEMVDAVC